MYPVLSRLTLASAIVALQSPIAQGAQDVFWFPITDGTTLTFDSTDTWQDSAGGSGGSGPYRAVIRFSAIHEPILDHQATLKSTNGWYLTETPQGYFRVSEGNPADHAEYRYLIDPEPFLLKAPLDVGQSVSFSGLRRGQWKVPGGGYEAWSGSWNLTLTNLGHEVVTTPLGTFDAARLGSASVVTVDSRALFPTARSEQDWTETQWFVDGLGIVKIQGSGTDASDYDGNGTVDAWRFETLTMVAVPVPEPGVVAMLAGGLGLIGWRRRVGRPRRGACISA
ncbi:MAG: PEP-CTERM sorting domain-containing protein [Burkholderiales bacterium]